MTDLIFSTPWWLPTGLIAVGIVLFVGGNGRGQKGPRNAGVALVVAALLLMLVSYLVETDKERVVRQSDELVRSVQDKDWSKMTALLDDDATVSTPFGQLYVGRKQIVDAAKSLSDRHGLRSVSGSVADATQDNAGVVVLMNTSATLDMTGLPVPSRWQFDWQKTGADWHVHQITCVNIMGKTDQDTMRTAIGR